MTQTFPTRDEFDRLAAEYQLVPIWRRLMSDALTPVTAFRRLDDGGPACLFESVIGGEKVGRYSFLAVGPNCNLTARGTAVEIASTEGFETLTAPNPLAHIRDRLQARRVAPAPDLPPFIGGAVGYAAYDAVRYEERLPNAPPDDRQLPDLSFGFYDHMVVFDNIHKTIDVIVLADCGAQAAEAAYLEACRQVDALVARLSAPQELGLADTQAARLEPDLPYRANFTPAEFETAVGKCIEYIRAGDIFQVVISQRLEVDFEGDPFEVYRSLRVVNPSPFMFFVRTPECTLVGSSPEIMCRVLNRKVTVRPLAGTRRRGATEAEDRALAEELLADEKERAEHVMLVDLGRNDVGRVARFGSVQLDEVMTIERYSHVMHISSTVTGELADGKDAFDAFAAALPAGTVSGAPKVRAMEIIDELEPHRRGPYAGAVGYFDYAGNMDTCITLRTIVFCQGKAYIQAGAGIVADSVPASEYQETLNKSRGMLKALAMTAARLDRGA